MGMTNAAKTENGSMTSMWVIRGVLIALSIALATVLILHGNVVIGALIGVMAVTRVVLYVQMRHRREELRQRIAQGRGRRF